MFLSYGDQPCFARKRLDQPSAFFGAIGPALRFLLSQRQQFAIRHQIRHPELGDSGLARSGHLAGATQLEVDLSETESIGAGNHGADTFSRNVVDSIRSHQDTQRLLGAAPDTAAQLMKLRKPEPFCVLNEHDGGVRDIDSNFDDGRGDEYVTLTRRKCGHRLFLLFAFEPAVNECDAVSCKNCRQFLEALGSRFQIDFFGLFNYGIDAGFWKGLCSSRRACVPTITLISPEAILSSNSCFSAFLMPRRTTAIR